MTLAIGTGDGTCGHCGGKLEQMNKGSAVLLICCGCGIVAGKGAEARAVIDDEIASGRAKAIDAAPGFSAMRVIGGPST